MDGRRRGGLKGGLQLLAIPCLAGGCAVMLPGPEGGSVSQAVLGLVLVAAGAVLLVVGRRPATRKAD